MKKLTSTQQEKPKPAHPEKLTPAQQEFAARFGRNLRRYIRTHYTTITDFCKEFGFEPTLVSKWITGFQGPSFKWLAMLHTVGVPIAWIITNEDDEAPPPAPAGSGHTEAASPTQPARKKPARKEPARKEPEQSRQPSKSTDSRRRNTS